MRRYLVMDVIPAFPYEGAIFWFFESYNHHGGNWKQKYEGKHGYYGTLYPLSIATDLLSRRISWIEQKNRFYLMGSIINEEISKDRLKKLRNIASEIK